jgi:toluene monooxygenase system ferredoxin subunit
MLGLSVDGNNILLVNVDDRVYAYADECPHQKSRLSEGALSEKTLRCARHHWEFDVCTGRGINPQNSCLKAFPVAVENRDILLDLDPVAADDEEEISTESSASGENQQ